MLLYHFPLNTQESIENFTNVGLLQDYSLKGKQESPANEGIISQKCLETKANTFSVLMNIPEKLTLAFRFRLKSLTNGDWTTLICFYQNTTNRRSIYWNANQNKLYFGGQPINPDLNWHNVVVEYQNNTCSFYLDNVLVDTSYSQTFTTFSLFDRFYDKIYTLQAYFQDIRIYNHIFSQAEINEYSRAMVVHYPLQGNELNPSVLKDVSGFGNDATRMNGVYVEDSPRAEISLYKSGTPQEDRNGCVRTAISTPSKYTISLWFKYDFDLTLNSIFSIFHASKSWGSVGSMLYIQTNKSLVWGCYNENNIWETLNVANVSKNIWHHIVLSYDGETKNLYYEGNLVRSKNSPIIDNYLDVAILLTFGGFSISDYRVYATALSAEDIKNLYNSPISVSKQHQTMAFEFVEGNDGFSAKKNGIVKHNELRENDSDVNGCYNDKLITNELIEQ